MKNRSPIAVLLLPFVTFGIYTIYWMVKTKGEMNARGADIPTAWFLIIPFVNIWWYWKYSQGVEHVTNGKLSGVLSFVGFLLLGFIMSAIVQDSFNNVGSTAAATPTAAPAPMAGAPVIPVSASVTPPVTQFSAPPAANDQSSPTTPTPPVVQ